MSGGGAALYDAIGASYPATRRADAAIVSALAMHLGLHADGQYLDLGCGSGNYTLALAARGGRWLAIDASATMLGHARGRPGAEHVTWLQGDAAALPCADACFDGVLCTLAIHHFGALGPAFTEIARVLRRGAPFVCFTSLAGQMRHYWLWHYFPRMMAASTRQMPQRAVLEAALFAAGLTQVQIEPFAVTPALQDLFLYSGKQRPALYLDAGVRANISSFARLCPQDELQQGLAALRRDLDAGRFAAEACCADGESGDYAFVVARAAGKANAASAIQ